MSNIIVNPKNYTGHELETIFFRPLLSGPSAESLGIRILYIMPMPTVVQIWDRQGNVLSPFDQASGWNGGVKSTKTYEDDDDLNGYVISLQKLDELLRADIKSGAVRIEKTEIIGTDDKEYDL